LQQLARLLSYAFTVLYPAAIILWVHCATPWEQCHSMIALCNMLVLCHRFRPTFHSLFGHTHQ
jgi:hypothetical protein